MLNLYCLLSAWKYHKELCCHFWRWFLAPRTEKPGCASPFCSNLLPFPLSPCIYDEVAKLYKIYYSESVILDNFPSVQISLLIHIAGFLHWLLPTKPPAAAIIASSNNFHCSFRSSTSWSLETFVWILFGTAFCNSSEQILL